MQYAAGIITDDKRARIATLDDDIDLKNATATFDFICRLADYDDAREDVSMDIDDFQMAFEQLFCGGEPLDEEVAVELMAAVNEMGWRADVTESDWKRFHAQWLEASTVSAYLEAILERKKADSAAANERMQRDAREKASQKRWQEKLDEAVAQRPAAATPEPAAATLSSKLVRDAAAAMQASTKLVGDKPTADKPTLLASYAAEKAAAGGAPSAAAARYRALDPAAWSRVVDDVGGLDEVLESIRRRIWVPLCAPRSLLNELGGEPVKGLLLHGPPGCGKSYLAARLATGLSRRPPTIVSGPEVMDKYIGSSEAALRALFLQAPPVPAQSTCSGEAEMNAAEENELHVIVLDEFDAIARRRSSGTGGGTEGSTAARDSVVNQLLALMDGVASLPVPTFVIALTNRRELVDPAVLRPGRLEVQVAVGRPDDDGRAAILGIHAEKMRASGRLALGTLRGDADEGCTLEPPDDATYAQWLASVASRTSGFSGAALAALVRGAIARALDRSVEALDTDGCSVTEGDFVAAIEDLRATSLELEQFLTDDRGRRDVANAAVGEEEAEREEAATAPLEEVSLADKVKEPSEASSPDALTLSLLSEQLAMALERIAALERSG